MKGGDDDEGETPVEGEAEALYALGSTGSKGLFTSLTGAGGAGKTGLAELDEVAAGDDDAKSGKPAVGAVGTLFNDLTKHINLVVVLIVVSIPEGLPLTI